MKKISVALLVVVMMGTLSWGQAFAAEPCQLTVHFGQGEEERTETLSGLTGDLPFLSLRDFSDLTGVYIHWFPDSGAIGWVKGNQAVFTHPRGKYLYVVDCLPIYEELPPSPEIKAFVPSDVVALPTPADPEAYGEEVSVEPENVQEEETQAEDSNLNTGVDEDGVELSDMEQDLVAKSPAVIGWEYTVKRDTLPTPLVVEQGQTYIHSSLLPYLGYTGVWSEPAAAYHMVKEEGEPGIAGLSLESAYGQIKTALINDLPAEKQIYGRYKTSFNPGERNRTINLKLAAAAINGQVIQPGKTFSFNKTVGPRTKARGYLEATIFVGGKKEQGLGGGICQVSSTLYNAVLNSKLKVVERHTHSLPVTYVPTGKDATVSYGYLDFRFQNNQKYPIKIQAVVNKNTLDIAFISIE